MQKLLYKPRHCRKRQKYGVIKNCNHKW